MANWRGFLTLFDRRTKTPYLQPRMSVRETSRSPAEDLADRELHRTMNEEQQHPGSTGESIKELQADTQRHLIFRRHSYLPVMGKHIPAGGYEPDRKRGGIIDVTKHPDRRN